MSSLEEHSHEGGSVSDESDAEKRDRHARQYFRENPPHLRSLLFTVVNYPIRLPESQLSGDVLEEHPHAAGDVSDKSDAEDCDRHTRQQFRDNPLHLFFLLLVVCESFF